MAPPLAEHPSEALTLPETSPETASANVVPLPPLALAAEGAQPQPRIAPQQQQQVQRTTGPAAPLPTFQGYALIERLGQGGMGEVWKARRQSDGLIVAIKVLSAELAKDHSLLFRFEKEVAALATLDHPGIVKLVGHDFQRRPPFFAMELCDGETLRERMSNAAFAIADRLTVFSELCRVLAHAHERGVIHRDLKPDNVLFDAKGHLKLIDFGLATLINGDPRFQLTQTAMTMGTVDYMPPEQRTDARSVDARGDVWSLGIILYELLAGTLPVGHFKPLTERMPGLDPRLDQLVRATLVADREARLQSAAEMARQIDLVRGQLEAGRADRPADSTHSRLLFWRRPKV
jgi:serine/threonine-protein kinase